jgi:hypothetical protein
MRALTPSMIDQDLKANGQSTAKDVAKRLKVTQKEAAQFLDVMARMGYVHQLTLANKKHFRYAGKE